MWSIGSCIIWTRLNPQFSFPTTLLLTYFVSVAIESLLFIEQAKYMRISEPMHWLFPLPGTPFSPDNYLASSLHSGPPIIQVPAKMLYFEKNVPDPSVLNSMPTTTFYLLNCFIFISQHLQSLNLLLIFCLFIVHQL